MYSETREVIAFMYKIITASLSEGRVNSNPTPGFVSLCEESRMVFRCTSATGLAFLESLSQELGSSIRSVAMLSNCLCDDDNRQAWSSPGWQTRSPFVASLRSRLPKLQEISLFVLVNMEIGIYGNYYHAATG
jgi:hypothetical protein